MLSVSFIAHLKLIRYNLFSSRFLSCPSKFTSPLNFISSKKKKRPQIKRESILPISNTSRTHIRKGPISMKAFIQILGTHTSDSNPFFLLHFDDKRYLFNCGEGSQRFSVQHKVRLKAVTDVFINRTDWDVLGGLPGELILFFLYLHIYRCSG